MEKEKEPVAKLDSKKKIVPFLKEHGAFAAISFIIVAGCWGAMFVHHNYDRSGIIYSLESMLLDARFILRGEKPKNEKIGILAIDERSIQQFGRWPFRREIFGKIFSNLKALEVDWIGFDVIFSEKERATVFDVVHTSGDKDSISVDQLKEFSKESPGDKIFGDAIESFENVVLGYLYFLNQIEVDANGLKDTPYKGLDLMADSEAMALPFGDKEVSDYPINVSGIVSNIPAIAQRSPHFGYFSNEPDNDAIVRWVSVIRAMDGVLMPSLALKMAAERMQRDIAVFFDRFGVESVELVNRDDDSDTIKVPVTSRGMLLLNHRGKGQKTFPHISLVDAYNGSFTEEQKEFLKGSILMVGATAIGINDIRPNPFDANIDGAENHAAALDNILSQDFMERPESMIEIEFKLLLIVGLLFSLLVVFSGSVISGLVGLGFAVGYYFFDRYYWFENGTWAYIGMPYIELGLLYFSITLFKYSREEKQKKQIEGAFGHYLSPEVISELMDDPGSLTLGGQKKELTVFFSDVRDFTNTSEKLTPEDLGDYMNAYFTPMTKIILESKGVLDKYIGDANMAFWGAPLPVANQADIACQASIDMLLALDKVQADFKQRGFPDVDIGIGLNTGPMSVGNFGSNERFCYTVMGDSVNLGARLEGLTKQYGIKLMVSEFTIAALSRKDFLYRDLDDIIVKGKDKPVKVFHLLRPDYVSDERLLPELIGNFEAARQAYYPGKDWQKALKYLDECLKICPTDGPSKVYRERLLRFKENPPDVNWDGVYVFKTK